MKHKFLIDGQDRDTLSSLIKMTDEKAKFEKMIKLNILRFNQGKNPDDFYCNLLYSKKHNKYIIKMGKIDDDY